jgi:hypothetical protein
MLTVQGDQTIVDRLEDPPRTVQDANRPRSRRSRCVLTTSCLARLRAVSHDEAFRSGNGHNDPMVQSLALVLEHEVIGRQLLTCLERSSTDINRSMRFA